MSEPSVSTNVDNPPICPACHKQFSDPKLLQRGHLLCRHCLISCLQSSADALCPLCFCGILDQTERAARTSLEDIADDFPTDLTMVALVDGQNLLGNRKMCVGCAQETATRVCLNCNDLLCCNCASIHKKMSMSRHHVIENLDNVTAKDLAARCHSFCSFHPDKVVQVYCSRHSSSVCTMCASTSHRNCPDVTNLKVKVEQTQSILAKLISTLSAGEAKLDRAMIELDQHLQNTEKRTRVAIAEIGVLCDRLETAVNKCRRSMEDLALGACSDVKEAVNDGKVCLLRRRERLTSHKSVVERAQEITMCDDVISMVSLMRTRVNDLDRSPTLPADNKAIFTVKFMIDRDAVSRVERELSRLGHVDINPSDLVVNQKVK